HLTRGDSALDFTEDAQRRRRDAADLFPGGVGESHLGEEQRDVSLLQLKRPLFREVSIEVLPGGAERLAGGLAFAAQTVAVRAVQFGQEAFVEGVAVSGDP